MGDATVPTIGYWRLRGLVEPIKLLLEYAGMPYNYKAYDVVKLDSGEWSRESWLKEKSTLGLSFPNLPYLIDGDVKLTQSNAILRYFARKANLYGSNDTEAAYTDMLADVVMDLRNGFVRLSYGPNFDENKTTYLANLPSSLDLFEANLVGKKWLVGESLTFPDFHFFEILDHHVELYGASLLDNYPNLKAYMTRFEALPKIAAYRNSARFKRYPINNLMANFHSK